MKNLLLTTIISIIISIFLIQTSCSEGTEKNINFEKKSDIDKNKDKEFFDRAMNIFDRLVARFNDKKVKMSVYYDNNKKSLAASYYLDTEKSNKVIKNILDRNKKYSLASIPFSEKDKATAEKSDIVGATSTTDNDIEWSPSVETGKYKTKEECDQAMYDCLSHDGGTFTIWNCLACWACSSY